MKYTKRFRKYSTETEISYLVRIEEERRQAEFDLIAAQRKYNYLKDILEKSVTK